MAKRVAVLAVDPVNGMGLFHYLEAFFEHKIPYTLFAVAPTTHIRTNSGVALTADDTVAGLEGREDDFDAVVFACGDAIPVFAQHATEPHNVTLFKVLKAFAGKGKIVARHCAAGMLLDRVNAAAGRTVAVHPLVRPALNTAVAADTPTASDGRFYTAQDEHALPELLPALLEALG